MGIVRKLFYFDGSFTPPAGVRYVNVIGYARNVLKFTKEGASFAIDSDGNGWAWGSAVNGTLGDNSIVSKSSPVAIVGGLKFKQMTFCGGITTNGDAYCWGVNSSGHLGDGTVISKSSPVAVLGGLKFKSISRGASHNIALAENGDCYAWGFGSSGQLGDNSTVAKSSPVLVVGGLKFIQVSAANQSHCVGITADGTCYAWGFNGSGQLGDGTIVSKSSPVAVVGGLKFVQVVASAVNASFGLTSSGDVWAWGSNASGQLGDGTIVSKSSPVAVVGGLKFVQIAETYLQNMFGITDDGTAYAWGSNSNGSLGDNSIVSKSSPVAVVGGLKFSKISAQMGVTASGVLYAWGDPSGGSLGDGTNIQKSSPVAVLGSKTWENRKANELFRRVFSVTPNVPVDIKVRTFATFGNEAIGLGADYLVVEYNA